MWQEAGLQHTNIHQYGRKKGKIDIMSFNKATHFQIPSHTIALLENS